MMEERQPTSWTVIRSGDAEYPGKHYLRLNCRRQCEIPLNGDGAKEIGGVKAWGWNGNEQAPSVTPSIACEQCGWHKTITNGSAG